MSLAPGESLGPYDVVARLGSGGMGEVYRARDRRLGRDLAIKILPDDVAADRSRLERFEAEARAASALTHPNIITVYDVGFEGPTSYIAMEFVEGSTLRELLAGARLPLKKTLDVASQIADGLARAHEAGIVHRDLKPENVLVARDGLVKILDFGLAKGLARLPPAISAESTAPTVETRTVPGTVLGTAGYMSPEQACGGAVDFRSDQFSFGAVLFEMLSGRRAFARATGIETLNAILNEDVALEGMPAPTLLRWAVERCLAKDPDERYASTSDLARDLRAMRTNFLELTRAGPATPAVGASRRLRAIAVPAAILLAGAAAAYLAGRAGVRSVAAPTYQQLTFRRGSIRSARFVPGGESVVFSAAWDGDPMRVFASRVGSLEARALDLPTSVLQSVSPSGELALLLDPKLILTYRQVGTLARASLDGGGVRELLANVHDAAWSADGKELAIARGVDGADRVELPPGHVLLRDAADVSDIRISRDGRHIGFVEHSEDNCVSVIDTAGGAARKLSCGWTVRTRGVAWSPSGDEIWFSAAEGRTQHLEAVSLSGKRRTLLQVPGGLLLHDVDPGGRALVASSLETLRIVSGEVSRPERELPYVEDEYLTDLSRDGKLVLFYMWSNSTLHVRRTDGTPPVRLAGPVNLPAVISPDARTVLALTPESPDEFLVLPIGLGETRTVRLEGFTIQDVAWMPDGAHVLIAGERRPAGKPRVFISDLSGTAPRPLTPEGLARHPVVSPDGAWLVVEDGAGRPKIWPTSGEERAVRPLAGALEGESIIGWSSDGRAVFAFQAGDVPCTITRIDVATGHRSAVRTLMPADAAGVWRIHPVRITPDGSAWAYTYSRFLSALYLVTGLGGRTGS